MVAKGWVFWLGLGRCFRSRINIAIFHARD
jgi:hypothetical protein